MAFRVGQKVVQVAEWKDSNTAFPDVRFTQIGVVYTIRDISEVRGMVCLRFVELVNPEHKYAGLPLIEQPFPAWNFRPVVERKTDISIFTEMLDRSPAHMDAEHGGNDVTAR